MVAWFLCASCCSGARERRRRRHRYQYEVVYRREESLYSGPDYLESLSGGRSSLSHQQQRTPPPQGQQQRRQEIKYQHRRSSDEAEGFFSAPRGRFTPLPLPTPSGAESLARQNRVNHFLTSLQDQSPPSWHPFPPRGPRDYPFPGWRSATYLEHPVPSVPQRYPPDRSLLHARSAPLLALPRADVISADRSPSSRDRSRDTSRDHSLASSANSSRPLLPQGRGSRPTRLPLGSPFRPVQQGSRSPHTPLSPGPPGYPTAIGAFYHPRPPPGSLTRDLRQYLSTRFPKGGVDHELQNTIRDNVYLRTVPVTTRAPRAGEVNGVDYTFLSYDEFLALQRSGSLLEAGIFEGHSYGTPLPSYPHPLSGIAVEGLSEEWKGGPDLSGNSSGASIVSESTPDENRGPEDHHPIGIKRRQRSGSLQEYFLRRHREAPLFVWEGNRDSLSPLLRGRTPCNPRVLTSFAVDENFQPNSSLAARQLLQEGGKRLSRRERLSRPDEGSPPGNIDSSSSEGDLSVVLRESASSLSSASSLPCLELGGAECDGDLSASLGCRFSCLDGEGGDTLNGVGRWRTRRSAEIVLEKSSPSEEDTEGLLNRRPRLSFSADDLRPLLTGRESSSSSSPDVTCSSSNYCGCCIADHEKLWTSKEEKSAYALTLEGDVIKFVMLGRPPRPPPRSSSLPDVRLRGSELQGRGHPPLHEKDADFRPAYERRDPPSSHFRFGAIDLSSNLKKGSFSPISLKGSTSLPEPRHRRVNATLSTPPMPLQRTTFISRSNPDRFSVVRSQSEFWKRKVRRGQVPPEEEGHGCGCPPSFTRLHDGEGDTGNGSGSPSSLVASSLSRFGAPAPLGGRHPRTHRAGNHYGTPKPPAQGGEVGRGSAPLLSGAHPSSEGKRRRNRSNVEAMAANNMDVAPHQSETFGGPVPYQPSSDSDPGVTSPPPSAELGPLPPNWEKAFTENGEPYFIDHVAGTSSWLDPRLARVQKRSAEECGEDELPFGWERIDDPQYGTYYIDHVNRKTQYENPVLMAKGQLDQSSQAGVNLDESNASTFPRPKKPPTEEGGGAHQKVPENGHMTYHPPPKRSYSRFGSAFTRNPAELKGEFLRTTLTKSPRGLGFTIVGGDDNEEEFLQIKSVVPNGPAWQDGKLRTGDVLVYVNDTCVLGYTHADVVNMFQNIEPGRTVYLEVCRGYALPFDPNDPNTEIVTTVAVTSADTRSSKSAFGDAFEGRRSRNNSSESMNTAKSMPDLSNTERVTVPRPGSADLLSAENYDPQPASQVGGLDLYSPTGPLMKPEYLTIPIVKGAMGFGFTIADSAYGQKVKKILDRGRCTTLAEGDVLVDINSVNVKGMTHAEVVQVLKDCPQGQEAVIMVQRGGLHSPSKARSAARKEPSSPKKGPGPAPTTGGGLYRSKTPTADMYSSQPKEVIPNRPKTPLVDTRGRPKTPNTYPDRDTAELEGVVPEGRHYVGPPYPGAFSYIGGNGMEPCIDHKVSNLSTQLGHASLNGNSFEQAGSDKYGGTFPQEQDPGHGHHNYHRELFGQNGYPIPASSHFYDYDKDSYSKPASQSDPYPQHPYYPAGNPGVYGDAPQPHMPNVDQNSSYGYIPYPKEGYDIPRQDSGYSSQAQVPPSRNPYPPYYGHNSSVGYSAPPDGYFGQNDVSARRKESTSFELEHPTPVPMTRFASMNSGVLRHPPVGETPAAAYHDFTVTLRRQENGFGFRIVGGTEEGSQVSIGHIVPGGAADQDGTVLSGDEIVCVDGEMVVGSSHHRVVQLMAAAANQGRVSLTLRRPLHGPFPPAMTASDAHNRSMEMQYPYDVTVMRRENEGFGFVIISSVAKAGSTIGKDPGLRGPREYLNCGIGRIIEGSPAERCRKLHIGDRILRVNGKDIKTLHHGSIVNLIKESGYTVTLTIGPPRDDSSSTTSNSQRAESEAGDEGELHHVELRRSSRGFGFSIRGGREFHNMPLFVLRIAENGPAAEDGKLRVGDQLMEINNVVTKNMTHAEAIELIKQSGTSVSLLVKRGGKLPPHLDPLSPGNPNNLGSPVGPPLPGTHIRSTATLPSGSPSSPPYPNSQGTMGHYGYSAPPNVPSSYPSNYPPPGGGRGPPQPLHSSPAAQYPLPLNPHASNGPLGQSSPRVSGPPDNYYWNRVSEHKPG